MLKKVDGNVGGDLIMECKVAGSQPMTVSWFKEGKEIISGQKYLTEFKESTASLKILHLESADAGAYSCRANNSAGKAETNGTLQVKG